MKMGNESRIATETATARNPVFKVTPGKNDPNTGNPVLREIGFRES
jgi:hypothetical protein